MFNIGENVRFTTHPTTKRYQRLTIGRLYTVTNKHGDAIQVVNDHEDRIWYYSGCFQKAVVEPVIMAPAPAPQPRLPNPPTFGHDVNGVFKLLGADDGEDHELLDAALADAREAKRSVARLRYTVGTLTVVPDLGD